MNNELRGEGVPESRGSGSGIWSRTGECPFGEVRVIHWALCEGLYTELSLGFGLGFPRIYLQGHVECKTVDLFDLYVAEFYKLGTPQMLVSILSSVSRQARKDGERAAQVRIRSALGLGTNDE